MEHLTTLSAALLVGVAATLNPHGAGMPPGHAQPPAHTTPERGPAPAAQPADVESIDAIIAAMYDCLSGPKGDARDWDRLRSLFLPDARYIAARPAQGAWFMQVEDFIAMTRRTFERGGYYESEVSRRTERFSDIAHVWSTYEARYTPESDPHSRGIYSIQLFHDGARWWIANAYWAFEREDMPIPAKYLDGMREQG